MEILGGKKIWEKVFLLLPPQLVRNPPQIQVGFHWCQGVRPPLARLDPKSYNVKCTQNVMYMFGLFRFWSLVLKHQEQPRFFPRCSDELTILRTCCNMRGFTHVHAPSSGINLDRRDAFCHIQTPRITVASYIAPQTGSSGHQRKTMCFCGGYEMPSYHLVVHHAFETFSPHLYRRRFLSWSLTFSKTRSRTELSNQAASKAFRRPGPSCWNLGCTMSCQGH